MALRHITTSPKTEDYTPLQEHQEQTPTTFFDSKAILYAHYSELTLSAPASKLSIDSAIAAFKTTPEEESEDALIKDVEIWVTSSDLILFQNSPSPTGVSVPYPSIALHATMKYKSQTEALYMNISLNDVETVNEDEDIQILELTVLPPSYNPSSPTTASPEIKDIFQAMNTCADLHPDPQDSDAEEEEDETAPGATGWITAENMDDFVDEEGNFRGTVIGSGADEPGDSLGPGAGTVRPREEGGEEHANGVNGVDGETKWQRTD